MIRYLVLWVLIIYNTDSDTGNRFEVGRKNRKEVFSDRREAFRFYEYAIRESQRDVIYDMKIDSVSIDSIIIE